MVSLKEIHGNIERIIRDCYIHVLKEMLCFNYRHEIYQQVIYEQF